MRNRYDFPLFHWHLEISSKCALACPRCPRTGPQNREKYQVTQHSLSFIREVFPENFIRTFMKRIILCGGQGDPIYNTELFAIIRHFKSASPQLKISIVTNGSHKSTEWWSHLAAELNEQDDIVFSVDGWDHDSNIQYRVNSDFSSILVGIREMVKSKAEVHWSTIVFKFNEDKIERIKALARSLGVSYFHLVFSTKFDGVWKNASGLDSLKPNVYNLSQLSSYQKRIQPLNPKGTNSPRITTYVRRRHEQYKKESIRSFVPRCMTGERGLYVDASGILYPCSWISHPFDQPDPQRNFFLIHRKEIDLNKNSLENVLNNPVWDKFFTTWQDDRDLYSECRQKCGRPKDAFEHVQFQTRSI